MTKTFVLDILDIAKHDVTPKFCLTRHDWSVLLISLWTRNVLSVGRETKINPPLSFSTRALSLIISRLWPFEREVNTSPVDGTQKTRASALTKATKSFHSNRLQMCSAHFLQAKMVKEAWKRGKKIKVNKAGSTLRPPRRPPPLLRNFPGCVFL